MRRKLTCNANRVARHSRLAHETAPPVAQPFRTLTLSRKLIYPPLVHSQRKFFPRLLTLLALFRKWHRRHLCHGQIALIKQTHILQEHLQRQYLIRMSKQAIRLPHSNSRSTRFRNNNSHHILHRHRCHHQFNHRKHRAGAVYQEV